jgi:hypothetical protein
VTYKNPTPHQTRKKTKTSKGELQDKVKGSSSMAKHVHISLIIAYKLYHHCIRGNIHDVVMSIFMAAPRSHGPSRERGRRSHIITSWYTTKDYLVQDQGTPEHIWGP